jgi:hypothetical protein
VGLIAVVAEIRQNTNTAFRTRDTRLNAFIVTSSEQTPMPYSRISVRLNHQVKGHRLCRGDSTALVCFGKIQPLW